MVFNLPRGRYIAAISGGVDSMTLMHLMKNAPDIDFIVGHFDHGIRFNSSKDAELVTKTAVNYGLNIEVGRGRLGRQTSEERARKARYDFLESLKLKHDADYIVTAHHQDDLLETAFINVLRGTGRRGITAIADNSNIKRPLLHVSKADIISYARSNNLTWRDDATNSDDNYLRNYLRNKLLINLSDDEKLEILKRISKLERINKTVNAFIATLSQDINKEGVIDRYKFIVQPQEVADELIIYWLKDRKLAYDKKTIDRLSMAIKTAKKDSEVSINSNTSLIIDQDSVRLITA